jgi:HTH-type transcriptional regulator/antitoxin HipB
MDFHLAFPEQLSQHLRSLRKAQGLSQAQLAARMGVAQSRISALEKDATSLTVEQLHRLTAALGAAVVIRLDDASRTLTSKHGRTSLPGGEW